LQGLDNSYDYYSDEEDISAGTGNKGIINSLLEISWGLEIAGLVFIFGFFSVLSASGSEQTNINKRA